VWVGSVDRFKVREKKEGWMDLLAEKMELAIQTT
jgi:hypothetical protein